MKYWLLDFYYARRWFFLSLGLALLIPSITLAAMTMMAEEMSEEEALAVAAVAVKNYVDKHPPRQGWRTTNIYIGETNNVVVDVHVPKFDHANAIKTRNERIKYSYLKLACPPTDAWVHDWLTGHSRIWVHLHHHGQTLIKGPCPSKEGMGIFS